MSNHPMAKPQLFVCALLSLFYHSQKGFIKTTTFRLLIVSKNLLTDKMGNLDSKFPITNPRKSETTKKTQKDARSSMHSDRTRQTLNAHHRNPHTSNIKYRNQGHSAPQTIPPITIKFPGKPETPDSNAHKGSNRQKYHTSEIIRQWHA